MGRASAQIRKLQDRAVKEMTNYLIQQGKRIIEHAVLFKETQRRSGNQEDAFGWAVYYNGVMKAKGYSQSGILSSKIHHGWAKHNIEANTGRGYLDDFFSEYTPAQIGFDLICVNAVYYSQILEDGAQSSSGRRYRIISQISGMIDDIQDKFKGSQKRIISPVGHFGGVSSSGF